MDARITARAGVADQKPSRLERDYRRFFAARSAQPANDDSASLEQPSPLDFVPSSASDGTLSAPGLVHCDDADMNEVLRDIHRRQNDGLRALDLIRREYLAKLHGHTGRNVIAYYSGFLSKPTALQAEINGEDINGFMTTVHNLHRSKGLDLILHTPGGSMSATLSIVHYLHQMFKTNIRAIIPQVAMSAGTMIACSCKEIWMAKHSQLGPTDRT